MQDLGYELPRIPIPRTRVNKGKKRARGYYAPKANKCTQNAALRKRKPRRSGAFLVNRRTSLVAQTAGHASVAEVAQEAVARDLVARNLHATCVEKWDADHREICPPLCGSTRARVVLDRVAFHLEVIYGLRRSSFEEHAPAGVVDRVSGEEAAVGVDDGDAPRAARDVVANELGVAGTALDMDAWTVGFRAVYNMVLRHSGVDAPESEDRASDIAHGTVSYNSSVASAFNVDHERPLP